MKKLLAFVSVAALSTSVFAAGNGAGLFNAKCAGCHGSDGGRVVPAMGVKPLNTSQVKSMGVAGMSSVVTNGIGRMPAFAGRLTPDQIKEVCTYVLTLK